MKRSSFRLVVLLGAASLGLSACRETSDPPACDHARTFRDSLGARLEKERIELQWARVQGRFDSVVATRSGKATQDRAARSLEESARRYGDSLVSDGGTLRAKDGCVDWNATWAEGDFDRLGMAQAYLGRLAPESGYAALEIASDTASRPSVLSIDALPSGAGVQGSPKIFRIRLDSLRVDLLPEAN